MDGAVIWLALQGGVFAVWTFLAFRTLFRLRARAVRDSGQVMPGLGATLAAFRAFAGEPGHAADRRALALATLALLALTAGFALTRP